MGTLKPCPFCGKGVKFDYDSNSNLYTIYCEYCRTVKSITCEVVNENFNEAVSLWNEREFDKKLLLEKDKIIEWIEQKYKNLKILNNEIANTSQKIIEYEPYVYTYGAFILKNGDILECDTFGHGEMLCKYFGINYISNDNMDTELFSIKHNIVKIAIYNNFLNILIPTKLTKKQKDSLYDYIINCKYLNEIVQFGCYNNESLSLTFNNLNDLLIYLDKGLI